MPAALEGGPGLTWTQRFNLTLRPLCSGADWVSLATAAALWHRVRPMPLSCHLFLATICVGCLANVAWRRSTSGRPEGGCWTQRRELACAAFRAAGFGFGAGMALVHAFLNDLPSPAHGTGWAGAAQYGGRLCIASLVPSLLMLWIARPLRIMWALPVQLVLVLHCGTYNNGTCSTTALGLEGPTGQRLMGRVYHLMYNARHFTSPPGAHLANQLSPHAQCGVLLAFAQLAGALFLPALAQAALESRLFELHQQQRRQAGLLPVQGLESRLYAALSGWREAFDGPLLVLGLWVLLGVLFDCATLLALGWGGGAAAAAAAAAGGAAGAEL